MVVVCLVNSGGSVIYFYGLLVILASSKGKSCRVKERDDKEERKICFINIILLCSLSYFIGLYVKIKIRMLKKL